MKTPFSALLFTVILTVAIPCTAKDVTVGFEPFGYNPRMIYAFSARDQNDRYNLQRMRNGIGVKRPDDPQGTSRMLDTLWNLYTGYDTTAVYDSVTEKDDVCLTSRLTRLTAQMFILDVEKFRSVMEQNEFNIDSADTVLMHWKGTFINHKQKRLLPVFWLAHVGHLFFNVRDTTTDSISMDTSAVIIHQPGSYWLSSAGYCKYEFGVSIEFDTGDSTAECEIRTDYFAYTFRFNEDTTPMSVAGKQRPTTMRDDLRFRPVSGGGGLIEFRHDTPGPAEMTIYSLRGEIVYRSETIALSAGMQSLYWNGRDRTGIPVAGGAYLISLSWNRMMGPCNIVSIQ